MMCHLKILICANSQKKEKGKKAEVCALCFKLFLNVIDAEKYGLLLVSHKLALSNYRNYKLLLN